MDQQGRARAHRDRPQRRFRRNHAAEENRDVNSEEGRYRRVLLPVPSQHEGGADDCAVAASAFAAASAQAARTELRNLPTSRLSRSLSPDNDFAAPSTWPEADPVSLAPRCTSPMLAETCCVPFAACCTLREISWVAAPCSSTAAAMVEAISDILPMVSPISLMAATDSWVAAWMPVICWLISPVALAVCSASALTSEATTAKPRPDSPARAASMVALSASKLVCSAMVLISSTTSPMRLAAFDNWLTRSLVVRAWSTASLAIRADSCTCLEISLTDEDSSSVAEATDCTLVEASSDAAATVVVTSCARSAVLVSTPAEASSSVEADDTVSTISPTAPSKSSAILIMSALRCRAAI